MWDTISGYLFFLILGVLGLVIAGWLIVSGKVVHSVDDLFLALVSLLFAVMCLGYLAWKVSEAISAANENKKKKK